MSVISYIMYQDLVDLKNQSMVLLPLNSQNQVKRISCDMGAIDAMEKLFFSVSIAPFSLDTRSGE